MGFGAGVKAAGLSTVVGLGAMCWGAVGLGLAIAEQATAQPFAATPRVVEALDSVRNVTRPRQDGYTTVWEGEKFVQCHALADQSLRCEAAGATLQPSLARVLTADRKQRLTSLGWGLDPSFGDYTQTFPASLSLDQVADRILTALSQGYGVDVTRIDVQTRWIAHQACPPRRGPSQTLAGMVDDDPALSQTAVHGCAYSPPANVTANGAGGLNLSPASQGTNPYYAGFPVANASVASDPVATEVVVDDPVPVREPRARRARRPRTSSGHREPTGKRHSRSGGRSSHHK